jgi:hypothetical protein
MICGFILNPQGSLSLPEGGIRSTFDRLFRSEVNNKSLTICNSIFGG